MNNPLLISASAMLAMAPFLVIAVFALVQCRSRLSNAQARARRLAMAGFSLLGLHALVGSGMRAYLVANAYSTHSPVAIANVLTLVNLVSYIVLAASLVLLSFAVFADRGSPGSAGSTSSGRHVDAGQ